LENTAALSVNLTAILELEWILRGFYEQPPSGVFVVFEHLLKMSQVPQVR